MLKRVITLLFCLIIIFVAIFGFAVGVVAVPTFMCYADSLIAPDGYQQVSENNQYGEAFLSYCKSRDSNITSSILGNSSTAAYSILADACKGIGFNIADLQSHLWYLQDGNNPTKWFFDSTGINIYNQAFAYLIHENGLEVGDHADVDLYSGYLVTDDDGNTCYAFVMNNEPTNGQYAQNYSTVANKFNNDVKYKGTPLKYDSNALIGAYNSGITPSITINGHTTNYTIYRSSGQGTLFYGFSNTSSGYSFIYDQFAADQNSTTGVTNINIEGYTSAFVVDGSNAIYLCSYSRASYLRISNSTNYYFYRIARKNTTNHQNSAQNVTINFTTNNNVINNNVYEGDTIINNEGDVITNNDNDTTINYNPYPDNPNYDPSDPTNIHTPPQVPTDPDNPNNINFPDLDLDLPDINWSIGDLSGKFPFSIPFDLVALVRVLDAPPEAPRFDGTLNLGITTYDYDINLEPFSPVASACRIAETLLFVFVLIMITRSLIKG